MPVTVEQDRACDAKRRAEGWRRLDGHNQLARIVLV